MATHLKWNGAGLLRYGHKAASAGIKAAGQEQLRIARHMASVPNTGATVPVKRRTKRGNKRTRTIYPNSSRHGESPRRRTGFGQKNIVGGMSGNKIAWRTGYTRPARYMTFHELGITYAKVGFQQRPTVVPALVNNLARLVALARRAAQATKP